MRRLITAMTVLTMTRVGGWAQAPADEPTKQEIATAYRSKSGEGGTVIPGLRWERWRIKEIRGWKLHFKRVADERHAGVLIFKYQATAKKNNTCAEYLITDTNVIPPQNVQMRPSLVVEPSSTKTCP